MKFSSVCRVLSLVILSALSLSAQRDFSKDFFSHYPSEILGREGEQLLSPNTGNYDVIYCELNLTVDPSVYYVTGEAVTRFMPVTSDFRQMYFDLSTNLDVTGVMYQGNELAFEQLTGDELRVDFGQTLPEGVIQEIVIRYAGQPESSGFGSFAIDAQCNDEVPAMWTLSEPYGAKHWWPCKQTLNDKYDSVDVVITTPAPFRAASNGTLVEEIQLDQNTKRYRWNHRYPVPAYLVAFAVSEYEVYSDWVPLENGDQLEILNYIYPCNLEYAKASTPRTIPIMQFFREKFGEYPYVREKYGHCNFGWGGGMEHSTMSFMGGFSHGLIAHELAHQWFGDKITCGSWQDIWLNEGFATYLEGLTYDFGVNPTSWADWKYYNQYRATNSPNGSVYVDDTTSVGRIFSGNLSYAKGAYLLHMLRWMMGDDAFFDAIFQYIHDPELVYDYARTPDLQRHLEDASGLDLDEFFADWLYGRGYPNYQLVWERGDGEIWLRIHQTPSDPSVDFFNVPVPIRINGFSRDTTVVLDPDYSGQLFQIPVKWMVQSIDFDPERWICAKSEVITAISDPDTESIQLFPNPAKEYIQLQGISGHPATFKVRDMYGRTVRVKTSTTKRENELLTIDLTGLPAGSYFLQWEEKENTRNLLFLVE